MATKMGRKFCRAFASSRSLTSIRAGFRRRRNCFMANRRALLLLGVLIAAACGCRAVRNVRVDPRQPLALTTEEAQKVRADGLVLYDQQPRGLVPVTNAARLLEQAARTLRDDYDAQWQAAQALAFLAENETREEFRREAARRGVVLARQARALRTNGVEG